MGWRKKIRHKKKEDKIFSEPKKGRENEGKMDEGSICCCPGRSCTNLMKTFVCFYLHYSCPTVSSSSFFCIQLQKIRKCVLNVSSSHFLRKIKVLFFPFHPRYPRSMRVPKFQSWIAREILLKY